MASEGLSRATWLTAGVWVIATVAIGFLLNQGAKILAPFAMAIFVWLVMEGFSRVITKNFPKVPGWLTYVIAVTIVVASIIVFVGVIRGAVEEFVDKSADYERHINAIIKNAYTQLNLLAPPEAILAAPVDGEAPIGAAATQEIAAAQPPTVAQLLSSNATSLAQLAGNTVSGLVGDMVLVFIYVAFLILTAGSFSNKLDRIFVRSSDRERARLIGKEVRRAMEQYLWVQTALSIIATSLTYVTLLVIGLDNALFWAFVIFVLNYIPTIGSIIATVLPSLFAIVQPLASWPGWMPDDSLLCGAIVFLGVSVWQFLIGNFVAPRMQANSLNLSALVVLLSLAVWGALWGPVGMFLSAPLTVMVMIVLAQIPGARWIAVLLSANGSPGEYAVKHDEASEE
ncbi:MAG: AI-2E family transporter [Hyphomonadaceae bacterium]|nr:AI-2E family transporter [Hyphomonadaceae bacterium]